MQKIVLVGVLCASLVAAFFAVGADAEDIVQPTTAQVQTIRDNCIDISANLDRIYANDALVRVNQGRAYDVLTSSLMQPLNARLVLNGSEAGGLVITTNTYQQQVSSFRTSYQQYERLFADLREINCSKQPAVFYEKLQEVRFAREDVRNITRDIQQTIKSYRAQVAQLRKTEQEGAQ